MMASTAVPAYVGPAFGCGMLPTQHDVRCASAKVVSRFKGLLIVTRLASWSEHLRDLLESDGGAAGRFYKSLVRLDKEPKWNSAELDSQGLRPGRGFSLRPYFQCLECPVACSRMGRREHHKKTGHNFCKRPCCVWVIRDRG